MNITELKAYLNCDDSFLASLMQKFIEEVNSITATIEEAAAQGKWDIVKANAHKMLSSVKIFDISELIGILEKLEIEASDPTDIPGLKEKVKKLAGLVNSAVKDMHKSLEEIKA